MALIQRNTTTAWSRFTVALFLAAWLAIAGGCETAKGTGALAGGGIGTLIGAAAGEGQGALIGAAIGTGVGYIIGDQVDEKRAKELEASKATPEVAPLGGTRWKLVSINTTKPVPAYVSKVVDFRPDARVITTTTKPDGQVETIDESYRVVGDVLIVNKPGYLVNAKYKLESGRLLINDPSFTAVLERLPG
jgi:hypothetical protein